MAQSSFSEGMEGKVIVMAGLVTGMLSTITVFLLIALFRYDGNNIDVDLGQTLESSPREALGVLSVVEARLIGPVPRSSSRSSSLSDV